METFYILTSLLSGSFVVGYIFGVGFRLASILIENKTKKVCDLCFRDIKRINEQFNKSKEEN